ncbi:hypothetical protein NPIL_50151 [Nephila pilipes]|uniref:Uncharacterized protein n=1 Tax=Nephila pilipes TaxID=299642 RepID=A0A8X6NLW5_NEPPI|nr:hypothetical protein NPIL_50151 [Nephila pilipes]
MLIERFPLLVLFRFRGRLSDFERSVLKIDLGLYVLFIFTERMASRCYLPSGQLLNFSRYRCELETISRKFTENLRQASKSLGNKQTEWFSAEEAVRIVKSDIFRSNPFCVGANSRNAINTG